LPIGRALLTVRGGVAHGAPMADDDTLVVIATHLRPEEAGMLRGLLESAGLTAVVRDDMLSSVNPFLQPIIGGAKLAVRAEDEELARKIVRSAGVLPGSPRDEPVEIPEEEWSRTPEPEVGHIPARTKWPRPVVFAAPFLFAMILVLWRCGLGV
jgi:putative signal transducing protein